MLLGVRGTHCPCSECTLALVLQRVLLRATVALSPAALSEPLLWVPPAPALPAARAHSEGFPASGRLLPLLLPLFSCAVEKET